MGAADPAIEMPPAAAAETTLSPPVKAVDGGASEEAEHLTLFSENFVGGWVVVAKRIENGRKLLEKVRGVAADLAALEQQYSAGISRIAARLQVPPTETGTVGVAVRALQSELTARAEHCQEFANALQHDLVKGTVDSTLRNHRIVHEQIYRDGVNLTTSVREAMGSCAEAAYKYDAKCRSALRASIEAQCSEMSAPALRSKLHTQALSKCTAAELAEAEYEKSVENLNKKATTRRKQEHKMLCALEDMDLKRVECLKDALRKFCIFRTAQLRNAQYDLSRISSVMEAIDGKSDVATFASEWKGSGEELELLDGIELSHWPAMQEALAKEPFTLVSRESVNPSAVDEAAKKYMGRHGQQAAQAATNAAKSLFQRASLDSMIQIATNQLKELGAAIATSNQPVKDSQLTIVTTDSVDTISDKELEDLLNGEPGTAWMHRYLGGRDYKPAALSSMREDHKKLVDAIWTGDFPLILSDYAKQLPSNFTERFASCLDRQLVGSIMAEKICQDDIKLANVHALIGLSRLCNGLLDWATSHNDFWTGRLVMMVSQFVYAEDDQDVDLSERLAQWHWPESIEEAVEMSKQPEVNGSTMIQKNLHRCLYTHPLWNRVSFWDEALLLTLSEDRQKRMLEKVWVHRSKAKNNSELLRTEEQNFAAENPCIKVLLCFAQCMTRYGILEGQVTDMISKACARFSIRTEEIERLTNAVSKETSIPETSEPDLQAYTST